MSALSNLLLRSSGALTPALFLPLHIVQSHLLARALPAKRVTYPLTILTGVAHFGAEHLTAEMPLLGEASPLFTLMFFSSIAALFYFSYKKTETGKKARIGVAAALFVVLLGGLGDGVPKDAVPDQKKANFNAHYVKYHLLVHFGLLVVFALASSNVSWAADWPVAAPAVPSSPRHTTLSPSKKAFKAEWPKPAVKVE